MSKITKPGPKVISNPVAAPTEHIVQSSQEKQKTEKSHVINLTKNVEKEGVLKPDSLTLKFEKSWNDFKNFWGKLKNHPATEDYLHYLHHLQYTEGKVCFIFCER